MFCAENEGARDKSCKRFFSLALILNKNFPKLKFVIMEKNMGNADRIVRIILAIIFGILYFTHSVNTILGLILFIIGIVFLLTSLIGFCPLYLAIGVKTCKAKK